MITRAIEVACPVCKAAPGRTCSYLISGLTGYHVQRVKAAAAVTREKNRAARRRGGEER